MSVKKYHTTKNGKKTFKGYQARPVYQNKTICEKYFGVKEKTKAYVWHDKMLDLAKKGYDQECKLSEAFQSYLDSLEGRVNGRLYLRKSMACFEKNVPNWLDRQVVDLRPTDISKLLADLDHACEVRLGRRRVHLKREVEVLHSVFEYYKYGRNNDFQNPVTPIHRKKWCRRRERVNMAVAFTSEETKDLLEYLRGHSDQVYYHIAWWQLTSNRQRINEVLSLEWANVDWKTETATITGTMLSVDEFNRTVRNTKQYQTKEGRTEIPVYFGGDNSHLKWSLLALKNLGQSSKWVFGDIRGNVPTLRQMNGVYKKSGLFNEKGLVTHKLRKTALTLATIRFGVEVAKNLGSHSTHHAHLRYVDQRQTEKSNPAPAMLGKMLAIE